MKVILTAEGGFGVACWRQNTSWATRGDFAMLGIQKNNWSPKPQLRASWKSSVKGRKLKDRFYLLHLPAFGKAGGTFIKGNCVVLLREIECRWCGTLFCICRSCWRGQGYCSAECRSSAKRIAHQEAQRRYRKTEKGKQAHCEAENRRRLRICKKNRKILDDTAANHLYRCLKIQVVSAGLKENNERVGRCHFCGSVGRIVDQFPRRDYGKRTYSMKR